VTVDGHLGIVTVGAAEFDLERHQEPPPAGSEDTSRRSGPDSPADASG
jgi:hypothetical protein